MQTNAAQAGARILASGEKETRTRNPFPRAHYFSVPIALFDSGLAAILTGAQLRRYLTFLRASNFNYGGLAIQMTERELEKWDGVSGRTAFEAHTKLEEYGLIEINRKTRPYTYKLIDPFFWKTDGLEPRHFRRVNLDQLTSEATSSYTIPMQSGRKRKYTPIR